MTVDVVVIGAGISGLATAHELKRQGHRVVVLERQVRVGGNALSERIDEFLMEHGPSSVNAASAAALAWSRDLGLEAQRVDLGPAVRRRYLTGEGTLHAISIHPLGFLVSGYLSMGARLRMLGEVAVPRGESDRDETVAQFCRRRFGPEFADRVIEPLVGGMFAGVATRLSMAATFPRLCDMERRYGSITRALVHSRLAGGEMPGRRLFSWREGIGALPQSLAACLGPSVQTGVAVRRIRPRPAGFRIEAAKGTIEARAVVVATQPHVAAALLESLDAPGAEAAGGLEAPPLAVAFLGYPRRRVGHPLDGIGYLTPANTGRALNGALFCSTMFPGRAACGHVALAGYIGGARAPDLARLAPADLIALTRDEFHELLAAQGEPLVAQVRQWPRGLPQYAPGHGRRVATLRGVEARRPGLFLTGNYFAGVSVAACLAQAKETSTRVHAFLFGLAGGRRFEPRAAAGANAAQAP